MKPTIQTKRGLRASIDLGISPPPLPGHQRLPNGAQQAIQSPDWGRCSECGQEWPRVTFDDSGRCYGCTT